MSNLPISSKYRSTPELPIPEDEREALVKRLNKAFSDGAISSDDYRAFLDRLFAARRLGELAVIVEALPPMPTHDQPAMVQQGTAVEPGELTPSRAVSTRAVVYASAGIVFLILVLAVLVLFLI